MTVETRIANEKKAVRHLIREMKQAGWECYKVYDGGEYVPTPTEAEAMDAVFSVDESVIYFRKGDMKRTAVVVLGNSGSEAISDHSLSRPELPDDDFEQVMERVSTYTDDLED